MMLTFKNGQFILSVRTEVLKQRLTKSPDWIRLAESIFATRSLKAALVYKCHSDEIAENVFSRTLSKHYALPVLPLLPFLDPHQRTGVEWILSRSRSYLAHAPGAGKTAQTIVASMFAKGLGQTVVIVPPTLTLNWVREILKFSELTEPKSFPVIAVVPGIAKRHLMNWKADFIIVPDSQLATKWVHENLNILKIKLLVVDEASRFKEHDSARSRALYGGPVKDYDYQGLFQDARHTVFLDGSPMPNRPMELWAPAYALHPESIDCLTPHEFGLKYCGAKRGYGGAYEYKGSTNEAELRERLQKDFMHVVTESELNHPERLRSMVFMNTDVRSVEHKAWERKNITKLADVSEDDSRGELATFRRELGLKKVDWIAKYVSEKLKDKNESILLFVWHREVGIELAKLLEAFKPGLIMGGTKNEDRENIFGRFQNGKTKLVIGNITAMGRGHNLQKADRAIFGEFSWSSESNLQCEKRASRRGRIDNAPVRCEYVVAPGSMDEKILRTLFTKEKRIKEVIG